MAFSEKELKQIDEEVGGLCRHRVPAHVQGRVRLGYLIKNQEIVIYEARPLRDDPSNWIDTEIAMVKYVRSDNEWRLYWRRASGKWGAYEPYSRARTLSAMVKEIDRDSDGCFFG